MIFKSVWEAQKAILSDYRESLKYFTENPKRSLKIGFVFAIGALTTYLFVKNNPDRKHYSDYLIGIRNKHILSGNEENYEYKSACEKLRLLSENRLQFVNCGFFTFVLELDISEKFSGFKNPIQYSLPINLPSKIDVRDFGIANYWFRNQKKIN